MKATIHQLPIIIALAVFPLAASAVDPTQPGKAGQTSKPPQEAPATSPGKNVKLDPAKEPGKSSDATHIVKASASKFHGKITAVDKANQTITINDDKMVSHTIHVADNTKGVVGAEAVDWNELKVGAEVHGVTRKDGDKMQAESLSLGK